MYTCSHAFWLVLCWIFLPFYSSGPSAQDMPLRPGLSTSINLLKTTTQRHAHKPTHCRLRLLRLFPGDSRCQVHTADRHSQFLEEPLSIHRSGQFRSLPLPKAFLSIKTKCPAQCRMWQMLVDDARHVDVSAHMTMTEFLPSSGLQSRRAYATGSLRVSHTQEQKHAGCLPQHRARLNFTPPPRQVRHAPWRHRFQKSLHSCEEPYQVKKQGRVWETEKGGRQTVSALPSRNKYSLNLQNHSIFTLKQENEKK